MNKELKLKVIECNKLLREYTNGRPGTIFTREVLEKKLNSDILKERMDKNVFLIESLVDPSISLNKLINGEKFKKLEDYLTIDFEYTPLLITRFEWEGDILYAYLKFVNSELGDVLDICLNKKIIPKLRLRYLTNYPCPKLNEVTMIGGLPGAGYKYPTDPFFHENSLLIGIDIITYEEASEEELEELRLIKIDRDENKESSNE